MSSLDPQSPDLGQPARPGQAGSAVLDRQDQAQEAQAGDHERFAHYVRKDKIMKSALSGKSVVALCGKVWVPNRDPKQFPVCPTCKEILEGLTSPKDNEDQD